jgi:hypothetical protein
MMTAAQIHALAKAVVAEPSRRRENRSAPTESEELAKAAPALAALAIQIDALDRAVAELVESERAKIHRVYLADWAHHGIAPNGHARREI